jgi:hypothetical protein
MFRQRFILSTQNGALKAQFLNQLKNFTCKGVQVSQVANCIADGKLCSDAGSCVENACQCKSGREGEYCEGFVSSSSDSSLAIVLGTPSIHTPRHAHAHISLSLPLLIDNDGRDVGGEQVW